MIFLEIITIRRFGVITPLSGINIMEDKLKEIIKRDLIREYREHVDNI